MITAVPIATGMIIIVPVVLITTLITTMIMITNTNTGMTGMIL
jgi:hypothetical protein